MLQELLKLLLCSFTLQLTSSPNFWNELLLLIVVGVCTWKCLAHINQIYGWILSEYMERLKDKVHPLVSEKVSDSDIQCDTIPAPSPSPSIHLKPLRPSWTRVAGSQSNVVAKKSSSNLSLVLSQRDLEQEQNLACRIDYFLKVSPSDYIRLDREKRKQDVRLESCYELTYLLEKVITRFEGSDKEVLSKKAIENNFSSIREKFKTELTRKPSHAEFKSSSIQSLLIPIFANSTTAFFLSVDEILRTEKSDSGEAATEDKEKTCKETLSAKMSAETIIDISSVGVSSKSVACRYDIF